MTTSPSKAELGGNPKDLLGAKKPPLLLMPPAAHLACCKVMELGAKKYGAYNWRKNAVLANVYITAAMRHLYQYADGQDVDEESGMLHIAHAMACMAIMLDADMTGNLIDDRYKSDRITGLIDEMTVHD